MWFCVKLKNKSQFVYGCFFSAAIRAYRQLMDTHLTFNLSVNSAHHTNGAACIGSQHTGRFGREHYWFMVYYVYWIFEFNRFYCCRFIERRFLLAILRIYGYLVLVLSIKMVKWLKLNSWDLIENVFTIILGKIFKYFVILDELYSTNFITYYSD